MIVSIIIVGLLIVIIAIKDVKNDKLEDKISLLELENKSLKIVMAENGLIPERFAK